MAAMNWGGLAVSAPGIEWTLWGFL
jgi:hypothetical protein